MVCKIHQSKGSMAGTLFYNQNKVDKKKAQLLGVFNIPEGNGKHSIRREFERYERMNIRTKNVSFQLSINPNPGRPEETLTDEQAVAYARELMDGLGYGEQPIVIYKHQDIERTHYHVVSIRTNQQGKRIKKDFERHTLQKLMQKYQKKYGYAIGSDEMRVLKKETNPELVFFEPGKKDVREQFSQIFESALKYRFTTVFQLVSIMKDLGVKVEVSNIEPYRLSFQGLDDKGKPVTGIITESEMGRDFYKEQEEAIERWKEKKPLTREQREQERRDKFRISKTVAYCLGVSRSEKHLQRMLQNRNIGITLSRTDESDQIFGSTIVDHDGMRVYKGSDLGTETSAAKFQAAEKRWKKNIEEERERWLKQRKEEWERNRSQHRQDIAIIESDNIYGPVTEEDRQLYDEITETAMCVLEEMLKDTSYYERERKRRSISRYKNLKEISSLNESIKKDSKW